MPKHVFEFKENYATLITVGGQIPQAQVKGSFNKSVSYGVIVDALTATLERGTMRRENANNEMDAYLKVMQTDGQRSHIVRNAPFTTGIKKSQSSFQIEQILFSQGGFYNFDLNGKEFDASRYVIKSHFSLTGRLLEAVVYNFTGVVYRTDTEELVENAYLTAKLNQKIQENNIEVTLTTMHNYNPQQLIKHFTIAELEQNEALKTEVTRLLTTTTTKGKLNWEVINNG